MYLVKMMVTASNIVTWCTDEISPCTIELHWYNVDYLCYFPQSYIGRWSHGNPDYSNKKHYYHC